MNLLIYTNGAIRLEASDYSCLQGDILRLTEPTGYLKISYREDEIAPPPSSELVTKIFSRLNKDKIHGWVIWKELE